MQWRQAIVEQWQKLLAWLFWGDSDSEFESYDPAPAWAEAMFTSLICRLDTINKQLVNVQHGEGIIMAAVQIEQGDIDALAAAFEALVSVIGGIDTTQLPPADESALKQALADVTTAINEKLPVTAPADPGPADPAPADPAPADPTA